MKQTHRKISGGLRLMWIGECAAAVGMAVETITLIWAFFEPGIFFLVVPLTLAMLAGMAMGAAGLWKLRGTHTNYRNALLVLAAVIVCTLLKPREAGRLASAISWLTAALGLLEVWLVVRATNSFLGGTEGEDLRTEGKRALWAKAITAVISLVSSILTGLLLDGTPRLVTHLLVSAAAMIVSEAFYLIYLKHSSEALA